MTNFENNEIYKAKYPRGPWNNNLEESTIYYIFKMIFYSSWHNYKRCSPKLNISKLGLSSSISSYASSVKSITTPNILNV